MKPQNKELTERDVKDLLTPRERPVPPADLAARIKAEIPADLPAIPTLADDSAPVAPMSGSRIWLMAASVVLAIGGGFLALRWMDRMPAPGERAAVAEVDSVAAGQEAARAGEVGDIARGTRGISGARGEATDTTPSETPATVAPTAEVAGAPAAGEAPIVEQKSESLATELAAEAAAATDRRRRAPVPPPARPRAPVPAPARPGATAPPALPGAADTERLRAVPREKAEAAPEARARQRNQEPGAAVERDNLAVSSNMPVVPPEATSSTPVMTPESPSSMPVLEEPEPSPPPPPRPPARVAERPAPRAKKAPTRDEQLRALGYVDDGHQNWHVEAGNAKIDEMRAEAQALERELKALEESLEPPTAGAVAPPSTGGTTEPNDAPYGDVFFESAGTNPFIDTEDDALSTFGLDVDTGSYTVARRYLRDGHLPPHEAVRVEEFINYFDYGDPAPEREEFAIHAEGAPSIYGQGERYHLLRFNISGRELSQADRRPALLTFVIDVSGSMSRENRLGLVKQALALLIDQLRADDRLALVIYGSRGQVVLQPTGDHGAIRRAIDGLATGGSTNAAEGLELAYELAARHRRRGAINRVILCSDGVANVGATSAASILGRIRREANQGIELTTVGFGMGNYNDVLMERLADTGNGRYAYVDTLDEARRIFVENLTGTLQTLAAEARVQVEFDPGVVTRYRLLGYENRDIADERFRDDTVDAGEIGVGHKVTALYEIKTHRPLADADRVGTLRLRYGSVDTGRVVEIEQVVTGGDFANRWQAASPALKLTTLVAEYAEILKRSYWAKEGDLEDVFRRAQRLSAEWEGDREVADFVSLVGRAAEYWQRQQQ